MSDDKGPDFLDKNPEGRNPGHRSSDDPDLQLAVNREGQTLVQQELAAEEASVTPTRSAPRMSFGRWAKTLGWRHVIAILAVAFALFPILYIINVSLNPSQSLSASCPPDRTGPAALTCLFPSTINFSNYTAIFSDPPSRTACGSATR